MPCLPQNAHVIVLREAMATDSLDPVGIYGRDAGDNWQLLADFLPPILSVETGLI